MANVVECTFGGKACYAEGQNGFNLEPGTTASFGIVTMRQKDVQALTMANTGHTLEIKDPEGGSVKIKNLYVVRTELLSGVSFKEGKVAKDAEGDNILSVHVADARWKWSFTDIVGHYNVLTEDGINYDTNTTASGTTPHTLDELLQKCWDKLDIKVDGKTGVEWTPQNVHWEFTTVAVAAAVLLRQAGWTLAWDPEKDSYSLLDLTQTKASGFKPNTTIFSHSEQKRDLGAERPKTAKVAFRVMRQKQFTMEAVLKHDGKNKGGSVLTSAAIGEWQTASTVLSDWGIDETRVKKGYYSWFATNGPNDKIISDLGGGDLGRSRLQSIRNQYRRFFRIGGTDRTGVVPIVPINPEVGKATGRTFWTEARPGTNISWHLFHRISGKGRLRNYPAGGPGDSVPAFDVRIVNPRDAVVEFLTPNDLPVCKVNTAPGKAGYSPQDYILESTTVTCVLGYMKKFANANTPEDDYHLVEKTLKTPNNDKEKTFLAPHGFLIELFENGDFTKQNQTELEEEANNFLDRYAATFDMPDAEEYLCAGIDKHKTLTNGVTAIRWNASDGATTMFRLNDKFGINPLTLSPAARQRMFALSAEPATILNPSGFGGGGKGGDLGSLDNHAPLLKDHGTHERVAANVINEVPSFVNDAEVGLLIASDRSMKPSGKSPCKGKKKARAQRTQTTRTGRQGGSTQITRGAGG